MSDTHILQRENPEAWHRVLRERASSFGPVPLPRRLRVAVLINLFQRAEAGGHVKCWERFAEVAGAFADRIDLTLHFLGDADEPHDIAGNVRFKLWQPTFCTARLPFLSVVPDHTDIAPFHPRLARDLLDQDVIHTTDALFAFANTARRTAAKTGAALVHSMHTDTPRYARHFTARVIEGLCGHSGVGHFLIDRLRLPARVQGYMQHALERHLRQAAFTLVSSAADRERVEAVVGKATLGHLGRGIDFQRFDPVRADRAWIEQRFGVPRERFLVSFAGRLNRGKNVGLFVRALDREWMAAHNVHCLFAGEGEDRVALARHFGIYATCPGTLAQSELAAVYASSDAFAFPSMVEISSNVVREALASGTCVLAASESGADRDVMDGITGRHLSGSDPPAWRQALEELADQPSRAAAMGLAARTWAKRHLRSWQNVLREDLIPVWQRAAQGR